MTFCNLLLRIFEINLYKTLQQDIGLLTHNRPVALKESSIESIRPRDLVGFKLKDSFFDLCSVYRSG